MKIVLSILASCLFCSIPGLANVNPVSVQCSIVGPVYDGAINIDLSPTLWTATSPCAAGPGQGYSKMYQVPNFEITFNNLKYSPIAGQQVIVYFNKAGCNVADGFEYSSNKINIVEASSGQEGFFIFNDTERYGLSSSLRHMGLWTATATQAPGGTVCSLGL